MSESWEQFHRHILKVCPPVGELEWDPWHLGLRPSHRMPPGPGPVPIYGQGGTVMLKATWPGSLI